MYYLVKLIRKFLLKMPLWFCLFLGKTLGLLFYSNTNKRKNAFKNIKTAFPQKTKKQINRIIKESFQNLGVSIIEIMIAPRIFKYVTIIGEEKLQNEQGIITGIHEGNYELFSFVAAQKFNFAVLARRQNNDILGKFLTELRQSYNIKVCFSIKELICYLRKGFLTAVLLDHGAEDNALETEFFSQIVPTPGGAVYLAKKFNKKIYPCFDRERKGFHHTIEVKGPIDPQSKDEKEILQDLNHLYETELKKIPQVYMWSYKRFKHKKNLEILILSDSKSGHLKQSKALLSFITEENYKVNSKIIEIKYRNNFKRVLAETCAWWAGNHCIGCGRCHKFILDKNTYEELEKTYADIVISAGSSTASINRLFSTSIGAKSIVILKPNLPLSRFDLALIPEHDRLRAKNAAYFKGAISYPSHLAEKEAMCRQSFNLNDKKKVSLFIGGPINDKKEFMKNFSTFLEELKQFVSRQNYHILISTSRRTPQETEEFIEKELSDFPNTETVVYVNRCNYDFVFEGFISLSDIIFITSDSISMISEIASLKKPCVCLTLEATLNKYNVFLQSLASEINFLRAPYKIPDKTSLKISNMFEQNKEKIKKAVKKLL